MQSARRRTLLPTVALLAALATPVAAQQVVNFRTLQQFLPAAELAGYVRKKPTGQTSSAMGMSSSEAQVVYQRAREDPDGTPTVTVTITDFAGNPGAAFASMAFAFEVNEETDEGYKKTIRVQDYKGLEEARTRPDDKSCEITVLVANRFMIKLEGYRMAEAALLHRLLDSMKLAQLERAGVAKG